MPLAARLFLLAEFPCKNLPKVSSKIESQQKWRALQASVMADPRLGSSDLTGGAVVKTEDSFLSTKRLEG